MNGYISKESEAHELKSYPPFLKGDHPNRKECDLRSWHFLDHFVCTVEPQWLEHSSFTMNDSNSFFEAGVILDLSEREKFCDNFRISGRSFGQNFGFPYTFYTFSLLPQLKIGRSQPA